MIRHDHRRGVSLLRQLAQVGHLFHVSLRPLQDGEGLTLALL